MEQSRSLPPPTGRPDLNARMRVRRAENEAKDKLEDAQLSKAQRTKREQEHRRQLIELGERSCRYNAEAAARAGDQKHARYFARHAARLRRTLTPQSTRTRPAARRRGSGRPAARRTAARSAASGDSGSDGSGSTEDDPPPLPPDVRDAAQRVLDRVARRLLTEASSC